MQIKLLLSEDILPGGDLNGPAPPALLINETNATIPQEIPNPISLSKIKLSSCLVPQLKQLANSIGRNIQRLHLIEGIWLGLLTGELNLGLGRHGLEWAF